MHLHHVRVGRVDAPQLDLLRERDVRATLASGEKRDGPKARFLESVVPGLNRHAHAVRRRRAHGDPVRGVAPPGARDRCTFRIAVKNDLPRDRRPERSQQRVVRQDGARALSEHEGRVARSDVAVVLDRRYRRLMHPPLVSPVLQHHHQNGDGGDRHDRRGDPGPATRRRRGKAIEIGEQLVRALIACSRILLQTAHHASARAPGAGSCAIRPVAAPRP